MSYNAFQNLSNLLYEEFREIYGNIITMDVVRDFLYQVDDLREVNAKYVTYLYDYVMDNNLWA